MLFYVIEALKSYLWFFHASEWEAQILLQIRFQVEMSSFNHVGNILKVQMNPLNHN